MFFKGGAEGFRGLTHISDSGANFFVFNLFLRSFHDSIDNTFGKFGGF